MTLEHEEASTSLDTSSYDAQIRGQSIWAQKGSQMVERLTLGELSTEPYGQKLKTKRSFQVT